MKRILAVSAFLLLGLLLRSSPGQQSDLLQTKGKVPLQHEVTVARKLVQVYVTDKKGNPISDLRRDEFILYDNKDEKTITEFENHTLSLPGNERRPVTPPPAPAAKAPAAPEPLMSRTFFFLFDLVFADKGGFRLGRQAAIRYLETSLNPDDQVAVLSFSGGRSLNVLHRPDGERAEAKRAIEAIGLECLRPIAPIRPEEEAGTQIMTSANAHSSFPSQPSSMERGSSVGRIVAGNFVWALDSLAQALRYAPGQKVLVLYSNGLHPSYLSRGPFYQAGNTDLGKAYLELCHKLAAANVSVFSVNTEENTYLVRQVPESRKGVSSLREITTETGGRFLGDVYAVPDHLEKIDTMTGAYYVLGYPIKESWDGKFHTIRVKVSRPDCEVHAQPGYFNPKPFAGYSKLEKEIHLVDLALSAKPISQDPERFDMQALPVAGKPPENVVLIVEIPKNRLADIEGPRVEVASLVFNALDEIVDSRHIEIALEANRIEQSSAFLLTALSARPGTYKSRVVLRNIETGRAAVAGVSVLVPEAAATKILVFPPLLVSETAGSVLLGTAMDKQEGQSTGAARAAQAFIFDPKRYEPYLGNLLTAGAAITAAVRCSVTGDDVSGLELSAKLISQAFGEEHAIALTILEKREDKNAKVFLARLEIPEVAKGLYRMAFIVSDGRSGLSSRIIRNFVIE
jgi:VWFA-related protein